MDYTFTLRTIYPYLGELREAAALTLALSVLAIVISLAIGAGIAVMRRSPSRPLRLLAGAYVEVMRNTPLLVILYIVYFAAPGIGLRLSSFQAALIGLSLNSAGYMAEILRAGLAAVPAGQFEASRCLGLTSLQIVPAGGVSAGVPDDLCAAGQPVHHGDPGLQPGLGGCGG